MNSIKKSAVGISDFVDTGKTDIESGARLFQALLRRFENGLMRTILNDTCLRVDMIVELQIMFSANAGAADPLSKVIHHPLDIDYEGSADFS